MRQGSLVGSAVASIRSDGFLRFAWRNLGLRQYVLDRRFDKLKREWSGLLGELGPVATDPARVLIVPSDPELLTASTGDQAMIGAIRSHVAESHPGAVVHVAVSDDRAEAAAHALGLRPLRLPTEVDDLPAAVALLAEQRLGTVIAMGADVLDGSYNVAFSGQQVMLIDLLSRMGAEVCITGFSVSKDFKPRMAQLFSECHEPIRVNLRDPVSFERFRSATHRDARLVADVAFLLQPRETTATRKITEWAAIHRRMGRTVLGLNCHPLLLELEERNEIGGFIDRFANTLEALSQRRNLAFCLVEHDRRGSSSDAICLEPLYERLVEALGPHRVLFPVDQLDAAEIKNAVHTLDGVVSGRMHLMIAALGAGTPVFGIDYKDKMEGLLRHFGLPTHGLLTAHDFLSAAALPVDPLDSFVGELDAQRRLIERVKPEIRRAARSNFGELH